MKSLSGIGAVRRNVARGLALGLLAGSAGLGMAVTASPASAENMNQFDLQAQADGMYILFSNANLPAGLPGAISPYAASATVNSNAVSKGFAGAPYLGPLLQTLPGLVGGLSLSQVPPLPDLPGFVTSESPGTPQGRVAQAGYVLQSDSIPNSTIAKAGVGQAASDAGNPQAYGNAKAVANDDGTTTTTASAGVTGLTVGPVKLLDLSSNVTVNQAADGKATVVNTTNLGTIEVAGIKLGLTDKGFEILGAPVAVPVSTLFTTINTVLAAGRTKIDVLQSTNKTDPTTGFTTVQSGGFRLQTVQKIPGLGDANVDYVFARSTVLSRNVAAGSGGDTTGGATSGTTGTTGTDTTGTTGTGTTDGSTSGAPVDSGVPPIDSGSIDTSGGSTDDGSGLTPEIPPVTNDPSTGSDGSDGGVGSGGVDTTPQSFGNLGNAQLGTNTELLYLVLVLGGAGAFVGQQLFSRFGVKLLLRQNA